MFGWFKKWTEPPRRALEIDVRDLLDSLRNIQLPGTRIGWPDDPTSVAISDPSRFVGDLDAALDAFRELRPDSHYLLDADLNSYHSALCIRFVRPGRSLDRNGKMEPGLEQSFQSLQATMAREGGNLNYWGGNNYFDLSLPFRGPIRESSPKVDGMAWDARYRTRLERAAWSSLRDEVFRSAALAESIADRLVEHGMRRVLIPSVGWCVHPWLFADRGLSVVATDVAGVALATVSEPHRWPRLYSRAAQARWDIAESASYASQGNPDRFDRMPDLEDQAIRDALRRRITFARADWARLPLERGSANAVFATNALPRESADEQVAVLKEWVRVVAPGGLAFILQHNFGESRVDEFLRMAGWIGVDILRGERPGGTGVTGFTTYYTSG